MRNHQRVIGVALTICLVSGLCGDWITNLRAATLPNPTLTKQQVELFGVGADVKVKLTSGKKLRGSIGGIDTQSFDLISRRNRSPLRITYDQVTQLKLAKLTYRASGPPNAEQARRVVVGLGVGKHVAVKVKSGKKFRGHLQAINEGHFVLLPDREAASIEIAYGDVQELGPNLSTGEKVAIIVGVVVAVAVIIVVVVALGKATEKLAETVGI